jgi:outer membrane protein assembly factor BamB
VADGDMVFASSGYNQGAACVKLSRAGRGVDAELLYHTEEMKSHHGGMVALDGYVYGANDSILACLEMKSGKVAWKNRSVGKAAVTYADGHLYVRSEDGPIALVEATPDGYREKSRFRQPEQSNRKTWAHPVVTGGKLFIRDQDKLMVFNVAKGK